LELGSTAVLELIGSPTDTKTFNKITGTGSIKNEGGANTFGTLSAASFSATGGNATINSGVVSVLTLSGAFLAGSKVEATSATLTSGFINGGLQLVAGTLNLAGLVSVSDNGSMLSVGNTLNIDTVSQLTLTGGSSLVVAKGAQVKQSAGFTIVQGAPGASSPSVTNNGVFTSEASFFLAGVPLSGSGTINLTPTASWTLNNVQLSQAYFGSVGKVTFSVGTFDVPSVSGSGAFSGNPVTFNSTSLSAASFDLQGGNVYVANTTLGSLTLNNGANFVVSAGAVFTDLKILGGVLTGSPGGQVPVKAKSTEVNGPNVQKLANLGLKTTTFNLNCDTSCQLITANAMVTVGGSR